MFTAAHTLLANADKPKSNGLWLIGLGLLYLVLFLVLYPRLRRRAGRTGSVRRARVLTGVVLSPVLIILGILQTIQGK